MMDDDFFVPVDDATEDIIDNNAKEAAKAKRREEAIAARPVKVGECRR
jgi:hypothetical protein